MTTDELSAEEHEALYAGGRCAACGHLQSLHDGGYDSWCLIEGCGCEYGMMPEEMEAQRQERQARELVETLTLRDLTIQSEGEYAWKARPLGYYTSITGLGVHTGADFDREHGL